jgi:UDP-N-acetylmuramate dehydrogenase
VTDLSSLARGLQAVVRGRVETDLALARFTTYRLGGPAAIFVEPAGVEDLVQTGRLLRGAGDGDRSVPVLVVGRGSNLVISDRGFPGVVVHLSNAFSWMGGWDPPGGDPGSGAAAGAATSLPQLANWTARRGLAGLEWAISIPGSVGGGVRMNAGAHSGDMSRVVRQVRLWNLDSLKVVDRDAGELGYSYRRSNLTDAEIVLEARLALQRDSQDAIRARMESYRAHRAATQPGAAQNAGSVFKNPEGDSAGRLVEAAGLKGFSVGGARVSELHANFFIAAPSATAQDVRDLVDEVRARVADRFGVDLQPEIRFVGEFDRETRGVTHE